MTLIETTREYQKYRKYHNRYLRYILLHGGSANHQRPRHLLNSHQIMNRMTQLPRVVISADYDGCWDIIFPYIRRLFTVSGSTGYDRAVAGLYQVINTILGEHRSATLMVGSARQSNSTDSSSRMHMSRRNNFNYNGKEGLCFHDYTEFVNHPPPQLNTRVRWGLDKLLLADSDTNEGTLRFPVDSPQAWTHDLPLRDRRDPGGPEIKLAIIRLQLQQVKAIRDQRIASQLTSLDTDFYFIDDRLDILASLHLKIQSGDIVVPDGINLHLVRYDWFGVLNPDDTSPPPIQLPYQYRPGDESRR